MKKLLAILASSAAIAGVCAQRPDINANNKLRMAEAAVAQLYVDSVDENKLVETAIKSMLESLDPHSAYSNAEETRELNEPLAGNFSGVGITFNMNKDTLYVISTVSGGPSERAGVLAGDRFIRVNGENIAGVKMRNNEIMKRLRGEKGTKVSIDAVRRRAGAYDTINFVITRADIPIHSVDASYMVDKTTGYIRLSRFSAESGNEVRDALTKLKKQGMKNLIFDLVDNGGGYMQPAIEIVSEFLPKGVRAVYTEGKNSPRFDHYTDPKGFKPSFADGRLVVMVNQYTASSSEITSGAIQDWDRGVIVGRRTFGKGLVQRPIPFADGSMMRLTVAHYYTPTGRDIQKPYEKGNQKGYAKDIVDRFNHGELMHADSVKYIDSLKVNTLTLGRPIYGGGGISPDKFVPLDTVDFTNYYRDLTAKGVINQYSINYVEKNRASLLKQYPNDEAYVKKFEVSPAMLADMFALGEKEGVKPNTEEAEKSRELFKMIIKGLIGRDIYDQTTYFKVYNDYDPIFKEAYRIISSPEYDKILK